MTGGQTQAPALNVAVLLSTFNGGEFIRDQMLSLLRQSYRDIRIYIRDDGSSDETLEIIKEFVDERIEVLSDTFGNLGPSCSFLKMLLAVRADIYLFCDQDDLWLPHKVQEAVSKLSDIGLSSPALFHTDLTLVDRNLDSLGDTFNSRGGIEIPDDYRLGQILIQNCVVGCTVAVTDALVEASGVRDLTFQTDYVAMHDWWLALCAIVFGKIVFTDQSCILYRQHSGNVSGASKKRNIIQRLRIVGLGAGISRIVRYKVRVARQAGYFLDRFGDILNADQSTTLRGVSNLGVGSGLKGILFCLKNRILFKKWYMNMSFVFVSILSLFVRKS